jgi:peptide/nickel transport system substrate-binding protein
VSPNPDPDSRPRRPRRTLRLLAAFALAAAATLAGCSTGTAGPEGSTSHTPVSGGTLTFGLSLDPVCLDPHQADLSDALYAIRPLVDSLTDQNPKTGAVVPWLAQTWQVNANATDFTFHLRPGVTFSDGTPVNAQSVKDNLNDIVALGAKAPEGSSYLAGYKDTLVLGNLTAEVQFSKPDAQFLQATSTITLGLLAESTLAEPAGNRCRSGIVGSGPFTLSSYTPNSSVVEARRAGYGWSSSLAAHNGPAYLSQLVFKVLPESSVRTGALESGQIDGIGFVAPQDQQGIVAQGYDGMVSTNPGVAAGLEANPDPDRPIVGDTAVRQAVQLAVNRQQLVSTVLGSDYQPATSVLAHTTLDYTDLSADLAYDPSRAEQLLTADGWVPGPNGYRTKNGTELTLKVIWGLTFAPDESLLQLLQQELKQVGVNLVLDEVSGAQFLSAYESGDYDFFWGGTSRADPDILRLKFSTADPAAGSPRAQLDGLLAEQAAAADPTVRASVVSQAQRIIVGEGYAIPVYEQSTIIDLASDVHGFAFDASSWPRFYDVWIS